MAQIFFPAVTLKVSATVVSNESLDPIQAHVLSAVELGVDTLAELRSMFGFTTRTVMELCNEMLRMNLLVVDFRTGTFQVPRFVSDEGISALGIGEAPTRIRSIDERNMRLSLNRATGRLGPARWLKSFEDSYLPVTSVCALTEPGDVSDLEIVAAINQILARRGERVLDFDRGALAREREGGFVCSYICVDGSSEADDAYVTLQFDPQHRLPAIDVTEMESVVLYTRESHPWFWKSLDPRSTSYTPAPEVSAYGSPLTVTSLGELADSISSSSSSLDLSRVVRQLREASGHVARQSHLTVLPDSESVVDAALELVRPGAQALVVCPFLTRVGQELLSQARPSKFSLERVSVAHGISRSVDESQASIASGLEEQGVLIEPTVGASVHAKVVLRGANTLLVGTKNFLSSARSTPVLDVGVLVDGSAIGLSALPWFQKVLPSTLSASLEWDLEALGWKGDAPATFPLPSPGAHFAGMSALVEAVIGQLDLTEVNSTQDWVQALLAGVERWISASGGDFVCSSDDLSALFINLHRRLDESGFAPIVLVPTAAHRNLLLDLLQREARDYLIVTSHRIGKYAVGPKLRASVARALKRGVNVVLLWGEEAAGSDAADLDALASLATSTTGQLLVNRRPLPLHAKLVLADDRHLVVTSYELLHFMDSRGYERKELGVYTKSERATLEALHALLAWVSDQDATLAENIAAIAGRRPGG